MPRLVATVGVCTQLRRNRPLGSHYFVCDCGDKPAAVAADEKPAVDALLGRPGDAGDVNLIE